MAEAETLEEAVNEKISDWSCQWLSSSEMRTRSS
jgi:hypothetical protein